MTVVEETTLTSAIQEITNDESMTSELINLFNKHSNSDAILSSEDKSRLLVLEKGLRWKHQLKDRRDTKTELEKMQRYGDRYVDHLQADIDSLEWAIQFIQSHSK